MLEKRILVELEGALQKIISAIFLRQVSARLESILKRSQQQLHQTTPRQIKKSNYAPNTTPSTTLSLADIKRKKNLVSECDAYQFAGKTAEVSEECKKGQREFY